ncbi:energy transducer TonB [Telmatobacter bradus]|uniref:energy transducer TonB n=1 Tax=Telmatobacter bradus TaxID=474953 RepID=UPI003B43636F
MPLVMQIERVLTSEGFIRKLNPASFFCQTRKEAMLCIGFSGIRVLYSALPFTLSSSFPFPLPATVALEGSLQVTMIFPIKLRAHLPLAALLLFACATLSIQLRAQTTPTTPAEGPSNLTVTHTSAETSLQNTHPASDIMVGGISEEQLKQQLLNKPLYLRGGYLDNSLNFNEHGLLVGHATHCSYTLSGIEITHIRLTKHKIELEAIRYGLHFLGAMPYEDPNTAVDRVRITPPKKSIRITIDREVVVKPKKVKGKGKNKKQDQSTLASAHAQATPSVPTNTEEAKKEEETGNISNPAEQLKASIAATPEAEKPADPNSVTTTTSPEHAAQVLQDALDTIFASSLDARMMAAMPTFWKLYYQAVAEKSDYRPKDPAVLRQSMVDQKAKLLTSFDPGSNEFAQNAGIAGMALYHAVIGPDGKPGEIVAARPIGFGLDEIAVAAIGNAKFQAAIKDGHPVTVLIDLVVQFHIFSGLTVVKNSATTEKNADSGAAKQPEVVLPGPYSRQP